ncbi:hypothetical protein NMY220_0045 [Neisseria meningitidis NM220]|nr:hypothetical protein NMY220_0045 [Neisseria meningitidis NM220]
MQANANTATPGITARTFSNQCFPCSRIFAAEPSTTGKSVTSSINRNIPQPSISTV